MTPFFNNSAPMNSTAPVTSSVDIGLWVSMGITFGIAILAVLILAILRCSTKSEETSRLLNKDYIPTLQF